MIGHIKEHVYSVPIYLSLQNSTSGHIRIQIEAEGGARIPTSITESVSPQQAMEATEAIKGWTDEKKDGVCTEWVRDYAPTKGA